MEAAIHAHGNCRNGHHIHGNIGAERLRRIQEVLNRLEHGQLHHARQRPDWNTELAYILAGEGRAVPVQVVCDIYVDSVSSHKRYAFELKAPLPNSDQTKVSKEKMFKLLAMQPAPVDSVFYALPYNPYGSNKADYKWTFPARWFDMLNDPCVLIGSEFWDLIGGAGTYLHLVREVNQLGKTFRERIYREYLGIDPPVGAEEYVLK